MLEVMNSAKYNNIGVWPSWTYNETPQKPVGTLPQVMLTYRTWVRVKDDNGTWRLFLVRETMISDTRNITSNRLNLFHRLSEHVYTRSVLVKIPELLPFERRYEERFPKDENHESEEERVKRGFFYKSGGIDDGKDQW